MARMTCCRHSNEAFKATLHPLGDVVSGAIHYGSLETQNERLA